jgi:hypothetical protein
MTMYPTTRGIQSALPTAAREAKARRQAVLHRVRAQRAQRYKKTVSEWIVTGAIIRGSELKERYEISPRKSP